MNHVITMSLTLAMLTMGAAIAQDVTKPVGTAPPITDCDNYAANPVDPGRAAPGVVVKNVNAARAIPACEAALKRYANTARFQYQLGRAYQANNQFELAAEMLRLAAAQNYPAAQMNMGILYNAGSGVTKDYAEALRWYKLAAAQNYAPAQDYIGDLYASGKGVTEDYGEALRWFRLAAAQDYAAAQMSIGALYASGRGVTKDYAEAFKWFRLAAAQKVAAAQDAVGEMYYQGEGVTQNYGEALKWYKLAADQNYAAAQRNMGYLYANGFGVNKDIAQALRWFRLAADQGDELAKIKIDILLKSGPSGPSMAAQQTTIAATAPPSINLQSERGAWISCISSAHSDPKIAPIAKHFPVSATDVNLAQLADATVLAKKDLPLITAYEDMTKACDAPYVSVLNIQAPVIATIIANDRSQEQDAWIALIQKKTNWGGFNQKLKAIYLDSDAREKSEVEKLAVSASQAVQAQQDAQRRAQQELQQRQERLQQQQMMERMTAAQEQAARAQACATARQKTANDHQENKDVDSGLGAIASVIQGIKDRNEEDKYCK